MTKLDKEIKEMVDYATARRKKTSIMMNEELHKRLKMYCVENGLDMSNVIEQAIGNHLIMNNDKGAK